MRIFQDYRLIPYLNVRENIMLAFEAAHKNLGQTKIKETSRAENNTIDNLLEEVHLAGYANHLAGQLSGGEQQRVAIARAVVSNPKLILADEPTGNLDSKNGREVMELLSELNREGTTVIMVTHSQHDSTYAHRVLHLFDGELVKGLANKL